MKQTVLHLLHLSLQIHLSSLLHAALCPAVLTSMDSYQLAPLPSSFKLGTAKRRQQQETEGQEDRGVEKCTPSVPSQSDCLGLAVSFDKRSRLLLKAALSTLFFLGSIISPSPRPSDVRVVRPQLLLTS